VREKAVGTQGCRRVGQCKPLIVLQALFSPARAWGQVRPEGRVMIRPSSPLTMLLSRHTRRREFITLLGDTAAWSLAAGAQLRISLALLMLAVSPVASNQFGEALAQCICHGCGCKGSPGWRNNNTGQCVSHKQLKQVCGDPPDTSK